MATQRHATPCERNELLAIQAARREPGARLDLVYPPMQNQKTNKWEITFKTKCGPRTVMHAVLDKAYELAEREVANPFRPTLVRIL